MASASYWTPEEDELLCQHYPTSTNTEIQALFPHRPPHGITLRASKLGIRKDITLYENGLPFSGSVIGHLSETEKGYLAGIIDGEGCISMNRHIKKGAAPVYRLFVQISNTSPALKKWLDEHFPKKTYWWKTTHFKRQQWRDCYHWILSGNRQVMVFCREIAPYLVIKKEQAELVAQGYVHLSEEERAALWQKLHELKKHA